VDDSLPVTSKPLCRREDALAVLTRLRENGHVAYFAGGCVRDELLGLTPKDFDIATDAPPNRVRQLFSNTQAVGAAFGVILVRHKKSVVEVATFRTDGKYLDGRRPEAVTFTTAEEDAKRRDFTINGMFLDPIENKVIDYVGGQEDLRSKVLRAIGDPNHRFEEDHLRLLRAIRFAARFGLEIEEVTATAITTNGPHLARISPERIADELRLALTAPTRVRAWEMMERFGLDTVVFRFWQLPWKTPHPEVRGGRSGILLPRVSPGERVQFGVALAAATLEYAAQRLPHLGDWQSIPVRTIVRALRQSLRLSNDEVDAMEGTLYGVEQLLKTVSPIEAQLKRFLARPTAAASRAILAALPPEWESERRAELSSRLAELEKTDFAPTPLINGDDLTDAGLMPGPKFKVALDQTYDAQLEGRITTRKEALEMAIGIAKGAAS
jgi:poly(A) polymerase